MQQSFSFTLGLGMVSTGTYGNPGGVWNESSSSSAAFQLQWKAWIF